VNSRKYANYIPDNCKPKRLRFLAMCPVGRWGGCGRGTGTELSGGWNWPRPCFGSSSIESSVYATKERVKFLNQILKMTKFYCWNHNSKQTIIGMENKSSINTTSHCLNDCMISSKQSSKYCASHSRVALENVGLQKEQKCNTFAFMPVIKFGFVFWEFAKRKLVTRKDKMR
jgi:hypothetical protein